jgi:hypothetical protein
MPEREQVPEDTASSAVISATPAIAPALGGNPDRQMMLTLQRAAGNRAAMRHVLARQPAPAQETLPQPGEAGHQAAFDAFVNEMNAPGATDEEMVKRVHSMRQIVDVELTDGGTTTLRLPHNALIVDRRNLTAVMTRLRWRAMDRIHEHVTKYRERELAATSDAARADVRAELAATVKSFIEYLQGKINDPESAQNRYEHWYDAVQASVLFALQARAVTEAQATGLKSDGAGKTRGELEAEVGRMGEQAWCGAFANYAYRRIGLDQAAVTSQLDGEGGVLTFMAYADAVSKNKKIVVGDRKLGVEEYHRERRSKRRIQIIANRPDEHGNVRPGFTAPGAEYVQVEAVDIRPGDILLLDNARGWRPDHIMIATAYDPATRRVSKIAGNEVDKPGRVGTGTFDMSSQPDTISAEQHRLYETAAKLKEQREKFTKENPGASWSEAGKLTQVESDIAAYERAHPELFNAPGSKRSRIAAVCRFSIVDLETHPYASASPAKAPAVTLARKEIDPAKRVLARHASPEVALAAELAPRLDDDAHAPGVIAQLDGQWIQYMVFVIKLLLERHGKKDRLLRFAPQRPRVQAAVATALDPAAARTGAGLGALIPDQQAQLRGFARRREWPTAIPVAGAARPAELDDSLSELSGIVAAVWHERRAVEDTMASEWKPPTLANGTNSGLTPEQVQAMSVAEQKQQFKSNLRGGYMKTAASDPRDPTTYAARGSIADADRPRTEEINRVVWEELGHEGDVGSINTYDNAVLTWGKGWAASGRLPNLMRNLPQSAKDRLLDLGLAYQGAWLALDTTNKVVLKGPDALQYVRFNTAILSAMYALGQGPSAQSLVDAQANVMFDEFDAMPKAIRDLDDRLIMVIVHCCWWGHMTMNKAVSLTSAATAPTAADKLRSVVRWQAAQTGCHTGTEHGATVVTGWQANLFHKMGRHLIADTFTDRVAAPAAEHAGKTLIRPTGMQYIVV